MTSYDELLRQVESLKSENSQLKVELEDNSTCLTKLESEASNMKEVLTNLHTSMTDQIDLNNVTNVSSMSLFNGQCDNNSESGDGLDQNSNMSSSDKGMMHYI